MLNSLCIQVLMHYFQLVACKINQITLLKLNTFIPPQDQILKKCMIILREDVREEAGNILLTKLADVWTQFFTSILPTLQAIFATVELKISIRTITLLSFRDIVLLKTAIEGIRLPKQLDVEHNN